MSNGIDFVIGGKDKAQPAMSSVEKSLERLEKKTEDVGKATNRLANVTTGLAAIYGTLKAGLAMLGGLDKINAAYDTQTAAVKKLNSALAVRGASGASAGMQQYAAQMQKLTGVGDEVTIGLMAQAQAMGFATGAVNDATKAAIGLSGVTGESLDKSLADVKAALQGNFDAFTGLNPQIMYMRTNQEKLAAVMKIASQGLHEQAGNMLTVEGSGKRANGAFSDLLESVGAILAPIRVLINAGIQKFSESLQTVLIPAVEYANEILKNIGPIIDWVQEKIVQGVNIIIGAFTFLEVIVMNLGSVWDLLSAIAERAMLQLSGIVMHTLTEVVPAYFSWFGENIINMMKDAFNGVITIITNAGKIIGDAVYAIFEFIASGGEGGIDGLMANLGQAASRSLLEGFESSLTDLPEIMGRTISDREKDLTETIGQIGANLGEEFSRKMEERMLGVGDSLGSELQSASDKFNLQGRNHVLMQGINATESRLLTRGPASTFQSQVLDHLRKATAAMTDISRTSGDSKENLDKIKEEAQKKQKEMKMVMVK